MSFVVADESRQVVEVARELNPGVHVVALAASEEDALACRLGALVLERMASP